jgi:hypothetical protein
VDVQPLQITCGRDASKFVSANSAISSKIFSALLFGSPRLCADWRLADRKLADARTLAALFDGGGSPAFASIASLCLVCLTFCAIRIYRVGRSFALCYLSFGLSFLPAVGLAFLKPSRRSCPCHLTR